jgi:hypothetical protein
MTILLAGITASLLVLAVLAGAPAAALPAAAALLVAEARP